VAIAWLGFFLEFTPQIQKGVLYLVSIVTNIATVTIGGTLNTIPFFNNCTQKVNFVLVKTTNSYVLICNYLHRNVLKTIEIQ
jgi:hypothetical protein